VTYGVSGGETTYFRKYWFYFIFWGIEKYRGDM
jgi:hypothetical protein